MDWSASLDTSKVVSGADDGAAALRAWREEIKATAAALADLGSKATAPFTAGGAKAAGTSGEAAKKAVPPAPKVTDTSSAGIAAKKAKEAAEFNAAAAKAFGKKSERATAEGGANKALAALGKQQEAEAKARDKAKEAAKEKKRAEQAASMSGLASKALGVAGIVGVAATAFDVTKIAIGYRAMGQLQAIVSRTQIGFRQLFAGVDPAPLVRAFDRFSRNFTAQTVMGRALGDGLTRAFNGIFAAVERLEPYITAFGQGFVLAFLYAENAVLRARIALAPYSGTLDSIVSSTSLMRVAAVSGGLALAVAAAYAAAAAAPFLALAAAILSVAAAFEQASKLAKEWDENSSGQIWAKFKDDIGLNSEQKARDKAYLSGGHTDAENEAFFRQAGQASGKAMGDGVVAGMGASEAAAKAAGEKLATAADAGVRAKAEIHSPARLFRRGGRQMGEGTALGMEDSADRVQRAAASSLVPSMGGASGAARGGATITAPLVHIGQLVVNGSEELRTEVRRVLDEESARAAAILGFSLART